MMSRRDGRREDAVLHPPGVARRDRRRPARPDVHPGRAADGLPRRGPERDRRRARRAGGPLVGRRPRPTTCPRCGRSPSGPRPSPSSSRTSRPPRSAGWPAAGRSGRAGGRSGSARTGSARRASSPGTAFPSPPGGRSGPHDELDAAVRALGLAADPQDGRLGLRRQGAGPGRRRRRRRGGLGEPRPGRLRRRGLGRVRRRGLGGRRPRGRRPGGRLSRSASTATSGTSSTRP